MVCCMGWIHAHTVMDEFGSSTNIKRLISQIPVSIIFPGLSGALALFFWWYFSQKAVGLFILLCHTFPATCVVFRARWQEYRERKISKDVCSHPLGISTLSIREKDSPLSMSYCVLVVTLTSAAMGLLGLRHERRKKRKEKLWEMAQLWALRDLFPASRAKNRGPLIELSLFTPSLFLSFRLHYLHAGEYARQKSSKLTASSATFNSDLLSPSACYCLHFRALK